METDHGIELDENSKNETLASVHSSDNYPDRRIGTWGWENQSGWDIPTRLWKSDRQYILPDCLHFSFPYLQILKRRFRTKDHKKQRRKHLLLSLVVFALYLFFYIFMIRISSLKSISLSMALDLSMLHRV
jgi:hypothetical protein